MLAVGFGIMALAFLSGWLVDEYFGKKEAKFEKLGHSGLAFAASTGSLVNMLLCIGGLIVGFIYTIVQFVILMEANL